MEALADALALLCERTAAAGSITGDAGSPRPGSDAIKARASSIMGIYITQLSRHGYCFGKDCFETDLF